MLVKNICQCRGRHRCSDRRTLGLHWPGKQVVINIAPADIRKEGS